MIAHTFVKTGIVLSLLALAAARPAAAEVILIHGGTFVHPESGPRLDVSGNRGFRLKAGAGTGQFELWDRCRNQLCQPGTVVEIDASWGGNDLPGTAELRGRTYEDVGSFSSLSSATIEFSGQVTMPPMSDGPISFTAPFDFAGRFTYAPDQQTQPTTASLTGGGRLTLELEPWGDSWFVTRAVFEFHPVRR